MKQVYHRPSILYSYYLTGPNLTNSANLNLVGAEVYFGSYDLDGDAVPDPILWRVTNAFGGLWGTIKLQTVNPVNIPYDTTGLNGIEFCQCMCQSFFEVAFNATERLAIEGFSAVDGKVTLCLGSPDDYREGAVLADDDGGFVGEALVEGRYPIIPTLNISQSAIIFIATASGKSDSAVGTGFAEVSEPTGAVKFSFYRAEMNAPGLTLDNTTNGTHEPRFSFYKAPIEANCYLSCTLEQNGAVMYYGKLADCTRGTSGSFSLPLSGINSGIYKLNVFCEQDNGDYRSDFVGAITSMELTVDMDGNGAVWLGNEFNPGDIAVINAMIDNNNLGFTKAPANGSSIPGDWQGSVNWSGNDSDLNRRITWLSIYSAGLTGDLDISNLGGLWQITRDSNNLTSINASGCTVLENLYCANNNITSLNLTGCLALKELACPKNNLTSLDVSGLTNLIALACDYNNLDSLNVSGCTALEILFCAYNNLASLDVRGCPLARLYCYNNLITTYADVKGVSVDLWGGPANDWDGPAFWFYPQKQVVDITGLLTVDEIAVAIQGIIGEGNSPLVRGNNDTRGTLAVNLYGDAVAMFWDAEYRGAASGTVFWLATGKENSGSFPFLYILPGGSISLTSTDGPLPAFIAENVIMEISGSLAVNGDMVLAAGWFNANLGGAVYVGGDMTFEGVGCYMGMNSLGGSIAVTGNITIDNNDNNCLVDVSHTEGRIDIGGNIDTSGKAINANRGKVAVGGNVVAGGGMAISCGDGGLVTVKGNVSAPNGFGIAIGDVARVIIGGNMSVADENKYIWDYNLGVVWEPYYKYDDEGRLLIIGDMITIGKSVAKSAFVNRGGYIEYAPEQGVYISIGKNVYAAEAYAVTVVGGMADTISAHAGSIVTVMAEAVPADKEFGGWISSGVVSFADSDSLITTFVMPSQAVAVTATWKDVVIFTAVATTASSAFTPSVATSQEEPAVRDNSGSWAILNLILATLGILLAMAVAVHAFFWRMPYSPTWLLITIVLAIVGLTVFLLTQDMNLETVAVDIWTMLNAAIFLATAIGLALTFKRRDKGSYL